MYNGHVTITSFPRATRFVWLMVALLFGFCFVSYMERVNISIAIQLMMPDLALTKGQASFLFNSFLLGYAIFQMPAGWLGDRFGPRIVLAVSALCWGLLTVFTGLLPAAKTHSVTEILLTGCLLRFLLGATEATTFPVATRAIFQWVSEEKRAFCNSLLFVGTSTAAAFTAPLVSWVMMQHGWRAAFYVTSLFAFVLVPLWLCVAPSGGVSNRTLADRTPEKSGPLFTRDVVLLSLSYIAEGYLLFTFISWLYVYLVEYRGFSLLRGGLLTSAPWIAAIIATPVGGYVSDWLTARKGRIQSARIIIIASHTLSSALILEGALTKNRILAVAALSASLGFLYFAESSFWTSMSILAGKRSGLASGFMNMFGVLGGVVANTSVPLIAERMGWSAAFGSCAVAGFCCAGVLCFMRGDAEARLS
jgi:ACS family glucarate transporter-like MFS transporter